MQSPTTTNYKVSRIWGNHRGQHIPSIVKNLALRKPLHDPGISLVRLSTRTLHSSQEKIIFFIMSYYIIYSFIHSFMYVCMYCG